MRTQHGGKLHIIDRIFATLKDRDYLKGVSVDLVQETLKMCGDLVRMRMIAGEHEELEASIGRRQILYIYFTRICGAHKYVREKALTNDEV